MMLSDTTASSSVLASPLVQAEKELQNAAFRSIAATSANIPVPAAAAEDDSVVPQIATASSAALPNAAGLPASQFVSVNCEMCTE